MNAPGSYRGLLNTYDDLPEIVRNSFVHIPNLLPSFPYDVTLSYMFSRVELAQNLCLYYGAVKLHRCHPEITWSAVDSHHFTRKGFRERFNIIFGCELPDDVSLRIEASEKTRDRILHGKSCTETLKREAIVGIFQYAIAFNNFVHGKAGFRPFGQDMRGFKGRMQPLDKSTTRWVLKGMGLFGGEG
jgi:hypothetical protein